MSWKSEAEHALKQDVVKSVALSSGGAFHATTRSGKSFFVKTSPVSPQVFGAEAAGLEALSESVRTPAVIHASPKLLILEWIESEPPSAGYWSALGSALAKLHSRTRDHFGFENDNFIGLTPQTNPLRSVREISWSEFFVEHRLKPMLHHSELATDALLQANYHRVEPKIRAALTAVKERPVLVHGDLWNGNVICGPEQAPVFVDPAAYYGHREVDLAMSELFGGFEGEFYAAYEKALPLADGYSSRKAIYNLYHLLNHWILFGESYRGQVMQSLKGM
jgi:protein-ribulosamine 3-kinase